MRTKIIAIFMSLVLSVGFFPGVYLSVEANVNVVGDGWSLNNGTLRIENDDGMHEWSETGKHKYRLDVRHIVLHWPVSGINGWAFAECINLTSVIIPDSIEIIGYNAFASCVNLKTLVIGAEVERTSGNTFENCRSLETVVFKRQEPAYTYFGDIFRGAPSTMKVYVPRGAERAYENVAPGAEKAGLRANGNGWLLYNDGFLLILHNFGMEEWVRDGGAYKADITKVTTSYDVSRIEDRAFSGCTKLESVTFSPRIEYIGTDAFKDTALKSAIIPDSVHTINAGAFSGCSELTEVKLPDNPHFTVIQNDAFKGTAISSIILPESIELINDGAFDSCVNLYDINFGDKLRSIGENSFRGTRLIEVFIPNSVTSIGVGAFHNASDLEVVSISANVTTINDNTFSGTALKHLTIPDKVTSIGKGAFENCKYLETVLISDGMNSIGDSAFADCAELREITFKGMTPPSTFGENVFSGVSRSHAKIVVPASVKPLYEAMPALEGFTIVGETRGTDWSFVDGTLTIESNDGMIRYPLESIELEDSFRLSVHTLVLGEDEPLIMGIGVASFGRISFPPGYPNMTSVKFAENDALQMILAYAFHGAGLTSLTIPDSVEQIGMGAFDGCDKLTEVIIGSGVRQIEEDVFEDCTSLTRITFKGEAPSLSNFGHNVFKNVPSNAIVFVTKGKRAAYSALLAVRGYNFRVVELSMGNGWILDENGLLTIENADGMNDWLKNGRTPENIAQVREVNIHDGVKIIGERAFADTRLTAVNIPDSVETIGVEAFADCVKLTNVTLPNNRRFITINAGTFQNSGLTSITIPDNVKNIGDMAFFNCDGLKSVNIGNNTMFVGVKAFADCTLLTNVTFGDGVELIADRAFANCVGLTHIIFTNPTPPPLFDKETFENVSPETATVYVPMGATAEYEAVPALEGFNVIETTAEGPDWTLINGLLAIESDIGMADWVNVGRSFSGNIEAVNNVSIKNGVTSIIADSFSGCVNLKSVSLPESVKTIGDNAFSGCVSLANVTIPMGVESTGNGVFSGCTGLKIMTFASPTPPSFGVDAFDGVPPDEMVIYVPEGARGLYNSTLPFSSFEIKEVTEMAHGINWLLSKDGKLTIETDAGMDDWCANGRNSSGNIAAVQEVILQEEVTAIGASAFAGCINFNKIEIPDSVETIGVSAFAGCVNLSEIEIPDSVKTIGASAFADCIALNEIEIPIGVETISANAFFGCSALTQINVAQDNPHFSSNDGILFNKNATALLVYPAGILGNYTIPDGVTSVGAGAFALSRLRNVIIPDSIETLGDAAFNNCAALVSITFKDVTPPSFGNNVFGGVPSGIPVYVPRTAKAAYEALEQLEEFTIVEISVIGLGWTLSENGVLFIESDIGMSDWANNGRTDDNIAAVSEVIIHNNVTSIADVAFNQCVNLSEIVIPENVTIINDFAFGSTGLTEVSFPESVTSIGDYAFIGCAKLTSVSFEKKPTPPIFGIGVFIDVPSGIPAYVPRSARTAYEAIEQLSEFSIVGVGNIAEGDDWVIDGNGLLTIKSDIGMNDWESNGRNPENIAAVQEVIITNNVTNIAANAFQNCVNLTSISIGNSVAIINCVFEGCTALAQIKVALDNPHFKDIDGALFSKDETKLLRVPPESAREYVVPNSVTQIGERAFSDCTKLTSITFVKKPTPPVFGSNVFSGVPSGLPAYVPLSAKAAYEAVGELARFNIIGFGNVAEGDDWYIDERGLLTIESDIGMSDWESNGRENIAAVKGVSIRNNVTNIVANAFQNCVNLTSVTIGDSVAVIDCVFEGCTALAQIKVALDNPHFKDIDGVLFNKAETELLRVPPEKTGNYAIADSVTIIGKSAFSSSKLTGVIIPQNVTSIGESAFNLSRLTSVTFRGSTPPQIGNNAFSGVSTDIPVYVPRGAKAAYETVDELRDFIITEIFEIGVGWELYENGALFIENDLGMDGWANAQVDRAIVKTVNIHDGVTKISDSAFSNCVNLTNLQIPEGVTDIGASAFDGAGLTEIQLPPNITGIRNYTFRNTKLSEIIIPDSVVSIGVAAFANCANLSNVTIGEGVTDISTLAFENCTSLTSIIFKSKTPPNFGGNVFNGVAKEGVIITVPYGAKAAYEAGSALEGFEIVEIPFDPCGEICKGPGRCDEPCLYRMGDCNQDGKINIADLTYLKYAIVGALPPTPECFIAGNSTIGSDDIGRLRNYLTRKSLEL
ncbi:MAG: leucine-rich repeat protein [Oscillospiraceae bacterium]|nr:leucine-rich repeat protein [Oscillospiraceae bacterium]